MQAIRRRTAQAIAQTERRQKLQYIKKAAVGRRERMNREKSRNEIQRKNKSLVMQEAWERWNLGELKSQKGWVLDQRKEMPKDMAPSRWEKKQQRKLDKLREKLKTTGEALLLEKENRRKSPEYNVAKGDRVVIRATEGPCSTYRGQIGTVLAVKRQQKVCVVEGMTIRQARAPKAAPLYTLFNTPSYDPEHLVLLPIPFSHMRIVRTIINGAGQKEDVILGRLSPQDLKDMGRQITLDQLVKREPSPGQLAAEAARIKNAEDRAADAAAALIPETEDTRLAREQSNPETYTSPSKKDEEKTEKNEDKEGDKKEGRLTGLFNRLTGRKPKPEDKNDSKNYELSDEDDPTTPSDTPRIDRDTVTWTPTLLRSPLPDSLIDELRGKYSKFRSRHDVDFVKRMQQLDSAKQNHERWVASGGSVLNTPRKEAVLRSQMQKRAVRLKQGGLDEKVMEEIGRVMWERGMRLSPAVEIQARKKAEKVARARGEVLLVEDVSAPARGTALRSGHEMLDFSSSSVVADKAAETRQPEGDVR